MDIREQAAKYYDASPPPFDDVPFYRERIPARDVSVLELGCGTGRVLVPLAASCSFIQGIDLSPAMVKLCREKMARAGIPADKAAVAVGDITRLDLNRKFDLIIAPYRVFQNLETDEQVNGFFDGVRTHLGVGGNCILNVFHARPLEVIRKVYGWGEDREHFCWEAPVEGGRLTCHERRRRIDEERQVLYPEAVYRKYAGEELVDEAILKISMRCYYPEQFQNSTESRGFEIVNRWGGYSDEEYGQGGELIVQFKNRA